MRASFFACALLAVTGSVLASTFSYSPSNLKPPPLPREFRAVWVASVGNINWPSKPGLSTADQKAELVGIFNKAAELRLNAVLFQVRPACDALYVSSYEPWSEYLTGRMGQAPQPFYDPLAFAVEEAHKRGMELHAWFNPFRARFSKAISPIASSHISKTQPSLVKTYGKYLWLDPGEPAVREHSLKVILDVVKRYDIDGVHMDDYFYPYPEKGLEFPDAPSWNRYRVSGGKSDRADWRRENVNRFIEQLYARVKREKPHVKVGVSPFGIWRPGVPASVRGFDAYDRLYADSRKWLIEGWVDYFTPQLYWAIDAPEQSFTTLLKWWAGQNPKQRHLWPGISVHGPDGKRTGPEVANQVMAVRREGGSDGVAFWGIKSLFGNRNGVADLLRSRVYTDLALVPASPWLDRAPPVAPTVNVTTNPLKVGVSSSEQVWLWALQVKRASGWKLQIMSGRFGGFSFDAGDEPEAFALRAIDRCGNESTPMVFGR
ncbi:MAG TPA: family 10 glycosylhydrolase [Verrucomicrobiae bacterium]|nr:family 10 glycosylhydrolase [Verrucomicrobiae bacterium]